MRVGIFSESYQPLVNGVSTSLNTLIAELERAGHSVYVFTSHYPNFTDDRAGVFRYASVNSMVEPDYVLPIPYSRRIQSAIPKLKLDIVHSQSPFFLGLVARQVARKYGIPLVSTNHTIYTEYSHYLPILPGAWTRSLIVKWMRSYYNSCDYVTVPSQLTKKLLVDEIGVTTTISVVPTGIPEPPYVLTTSEETKESLGIPRDSRVLLYVGRLAAEKNLPVLLEAFVRILAKHENAYLILAGSGNSAPQIQAHADTLGILSHTIFTGFLNRTKLDPLYFAADVFLFPSKTETQGLAVGEALAAGTPCVIVNAGGSPESVHHGEDGFVVEDSPDAMAEKALLLLGNDQLRRQMSESGKKHAEDMRPEKIALRMMAIYEALVQGTPLQENPEVAVEKERKSEL